MSKMQGGDRLMTGKFKYRTFFYMLLSIVFLTVVSAIAYLLGFAGLLDKLSGFNCFDALAGQIANTLIVLSLTSVLSSDFGHAYWVDIKETKLIKPIWSCFTGITVYLLTGLLYSLVAYILGKNLAVAVSAVFSTLLLIFLSFKMISIYFGKEELKKELSIEYRKLLILTDNSYVEDYSRRLARFLDQIENEEFHKKWLHIYKTEKELRCLNDALNSGNSKRIDECQSSHMDNYIKGLDQLKNYDSKIIEFTQNAIKNNETEVVQENISLLVDSENYETYFNLLEDLFDWNEKYACKTLLKLSQKNKAWVIKDKMSFFKKYALDKMLNGSGELDSIQNLLLIYDPSNLGLKNVESQLKNIGEKFLEIEKDETQLEKEIAEAEDMIAYAKSQKQRRDALKNSKEEEKNKLIEIYKKLGTKDIRAYYVPVDELCFAYEEHRYSAAQKCLDVILYTAEQDRAYIKSTLAISNIDLSDEFFFSYSYLTDEELIKVNRIIELDKDLNILKPNQKKRLQALAEVKISNNPMEDINEHALDIFKSALD